MSSNNDIFDFTVRYLDEDYCVKKVSYVTAVVANEMFNKSSFIPMNKIQNKDTCIKRFHHLVGYDRRSLEIICILTDIEGLMTFENWE